MADTTINPWVFTSADVSASPFTTAQLCTQSIRWVGAAVGAHAVLKNRHGKVVWEGFNATANDVDESVPQRRPYSSDIWDGLIIDTLPSGNLYLYLM